MIASHAGHAPSHAGHAPSMPSPLVLPSVDMSDHIPSHSLALNEAAGTDGKPPPLIRTTSAGDVGMSKVKVCGRISPSERRKAAKTIAGIKRKPYMSDEERMGKERERRSANNQRERLVS